MKANGNELFDVVIFDMESRKVESIVGVGLYMDKGTYNAERRLETALGRINLDRYSAEIVPTGAYPVGATLPEQCAEQPKPPLEATEEHREQGATDLQRAYPERRP